MCGIAGFINFDKRDITHSILKDMSDVIVHRGFDDEGYVLIDQNSSEFVLYSGSESPESIKNNFPLFNSSQYLKSANIGLSHKRFSIIDLTIGGHQPFVDKNQVCCVVYNGEIYNYVELREQLQNKGVVFRTQSDTEVLVEAYKAWGVDCFSRLNGFWAIALYDFKKNRLIISRDRLGKKPLYWTKVESRIYFASEIKSLLKVPAVAQRIKVNEKAIYPWLKHGLRDLNFSTFFEGIYSLPSASWSVVDENFPNNINTFWEAPKFRKSESDISIPEACSSIRDTLDDAVKIRLRADVPWSVELSGGIDSSLLVALAAQNYNKKITTYTVRFPDKQWNEEPYARSIAEHYDTNYKVIESPLENFWIQLLPFSYLEEEPYHSPNLQTEMVIWSIMRANNTKVTLNGAAGDELFAGYTRYYTQAQIENLKTGNLKYFFNNAWNWSEIQSSLKSLALTSKWLLEDAGRWLVSKYLSDGFNKVPYLKNGFSTNEQFNSFTLTDSLYNDMTNTIMPYWLRSDDKGYMAIPIEIRAPFLDYRLVEMAMQLPVTYLLRNGWHKWILRKACEDILPHDVLWRKKKMGFPFPYQRFYENSDKILNTIFKNANNPYIDFSKKDDFKNDWNAISFILWYELFFNQNINLFEKIQKVATQSNKEINYGFTPQYLISGQLN